MKLHALIALFAIAGCGGNGTPSGGPDLAVSPDMTAPPSDMATPANADLTTLPDLKMVVPGTQLLSGDFTLQNLTTDGWAILQDNGTGDVTAQPLAGGKSTLIAQNPFSIQVSGKVVLVWHDGDGATEGTLTVWTAAGGVKDVSQSSPAGIGGVASDSGLIGYYDNLSDAGDTADLILDKPDHSAPKTLLKGVIQFQQDADGGALANDNCTPAVGFAGTRLLVTHCAGAVGDGGVRSATLTSYDAAGTGVDIATDVQPYVITDKAGTVVLAIDAAGAGSLLPPAGGKAIATGLADVSSANFTADGSALLYTDKSGRVARVSTKDGTIIVLQAKGADAIDSVSPDGKWLLFHTQFDNSTFLEDLLLTSATVAGNPTSLSKDPNAATGGMWGDSWTSDSTQSLYFSVGDPMSGVGALTAQPVAGGAAKKLNADSLAVYGAGGTKVVYNANFGNTNMNTAGQADLFVVDLAKNAAPALIATQAESAFFVTGDQKSVAYTYTLDPNRNGLYLAPLP